MSLLTTVIGSKIAAGLLAAGVVAGGGAGVAAYADVLPAPVQQTAHELIGAPAPDVETDATASGETSTDATDSVSTATEAPGSDAATTETATDDESTGADATETDATDDADATASPTATPVGPDATGPAAHGLCTAYTHGGLAVSSTAYAALVTAASGAANIDAYCATIPAPGKSASHHVKVDTSATSALSATQRQATTQLATTQPTVKAHTSTSTAAKANAHAPKLSSVADDAAATKAHVSAGASHKSAAHGRP